MKTAVHLDYQAVLANRAQPVHLAFHFTALSSDHARPQPIAFTVVLDRSGSMQGEPLENAKRAARDAVSNLRKGDLFSLVVFDNEAQTVIPLGPVTNRAATLAAITQIESGGSTNLTGGWMLGRDNLSQAPAGSLRRLLLLTDGQLNVGIVDPGQVLRLVTDGLETRHIRTSCLGFGPEYNEDLMSQLSTATGGVFYNARSSDLLPAIFAAELEGLQKTAVQNLRLRLKPSAFLDACASLAEYPAVKLADGRIEFQIGDLVSEEDCVAVFELAVLPIPELQPGRPAATLDGEVLADIEIVYDEISADGIVSKSECHIIRVRPTQDPAEIIVNETALPWVSAQTAAKVLQEAVAKRDAGDVTAAMKLLDDAIAKLKGYARDAQIADGLRLLERFREQLGDGDYNLARKMAMSDSKSYRRMRSHALWCSESPAPSFSKRPDKVTGPRDSTSGAPTATPPASP